MIQQSPTEERAREVRRIVQRLAEGTVGTKLAAEALIALTSQAAQPAEADGWVMVPRVMTDAMREVFHDRVRISDGTAIRVTVQMIGEAAQIEGKEE